MSQDIFCDSAIMQVINYAIQYGTSIEHAMREVNLTFYNVCKLYDLYSEFLLTRINQVCDKIVEQKKDKINILAELKNYKMASKFKRQVKMQLKGKYGVVIN